MTEIELNNCDLEPIHIPGKIQSHGFLLVIDPEQHIITHVSDNAGQWLNTSAASLLGQPIGSLETLLGKKSGGAFIESIITSNTGHKGFDPNNPFSVTINGAEWLLAIHATEQGYLLDFEPGESDLNADLQLFLGRSLSHILSNRNLEDVLEHATAQVRQIIRYDRVMIYRFHEDGHGEVVAESRDEKLDPWLGLHYPASDIPRQARELYKRNLTRLISDVHQQPSALWSLTETPLDLTQSALRAVSPVHIQYLKNMGVASSFSVSILCNDELWGLIACHNYSPRFIHYRQRESAQLLGQVLSSAIDLRQQEARQLLAQQHHKALENLTRYLSRDLSLQEALFEQETTMLDAFDATGAVLLFENRFYSVGQVPEEKFLRGLCLWLSRNMEGELFSTAALGKHFLPAQGQEATASGLLACRLARNLNEFMLWFRPEIMTKVTWAGHPEKPTQTDANGMPFISPRKSFEAWTELVHGNATSWNESDEELALQLKDEINYFINRKAIELRAMNEKLMEAYAELDTFAYTISHDLKNPLTAIKGYAQLLSSSEALHPTHRQMGQNIEVSAGKMGGMIEEILAYSKVGQFKLEPRQIDMKELLEEIRTESLLTDINPNLVVEIGNTPEILGDRTMIYQLFTNLISNAIKYSYDEKHPSVRIVGEVYNDHVLYVISDNGIGIKEEDHERIFELFSRSSNAVRFNGSGVGLSIVKRIIERHNGEISLESSIGKGSRFFVKFRNNPATLSGMDLFSFQSKNTFQD